jgi:hypothetical protein
MRRFDGRQARKNVPAENVYIPYLLEWLAAL